MILSSTGTVAYSVTLFTMGELRRVGSGWDYSRGRDVSTLVALCSRPRPSTGSATLPESVNLSDAPLQ